MGEIDRAVASYLRSLMIDNRETVRVDGFLAGFDTMSRSPGVNYAVPDDEAEPGLQAVQALIETFRNRGCMPRIEYLPGAAPAVEPVLLRAGFRREGLLTVMMVAREHFVEVLPPPGFAIRPPAGDQERMSMRRVQARAFGDPDPDPVELLRLHAGVRRGFQPLIAVDEAGTVVGAAELTPPREGLAELVGVAVDARFRRRGIGCAITGALVRAAFQGGLARVWLTPAGVAEERIYGRVGFRVETTALHMAVPPA